MSGAKNPTEIAPGVAFWSAWFDADEQAALAGEVFRLADEAPFYRPRMPRSGKPFSVEETNFGSLGWYSDEEGYRYEALHPVTRRPWPAIPDVLMGLWREVARCAAPPECCLVNLYRCGARMGLHQDRDEAALDAPVISVSLGDTAQFRIGGPTRKGPTKTLTLASGDVVMFGGASRLAFHGIARVVHDTSAIVAGAGRLNLTLRRVTGISEMRGCTKSRMHKIKDARPGG